MKDKPENIIDERRHYESLISVFKYMVGAIVLLGGLIAWMIGSNLNDTKYNLTKDFGDIKSEIISMRKESQSSLKESSELAEKQIENLRKNTETYLNMTKEITSIQIATIREDARNLVLSSARLKIEESFKSNDIQLLIDEAAKKEIGDRLNEVVQREIDKTSIIFDKFQILTSVYDRIRWGDRSALDLLDSIANNSDNPTIKRVAKGYLLQKGKDYEKAIPELISEDVSTINPFDQLGMKVFFPISKSDSIRITSDLKRIIYKDPDLYRVTLSFMALKYIIYKNIQSFDFDSVRRLDSIK